jgi:hypothetical protein
LGASPEGFVERVILEDILAFAATIVGMGCFTGIVIAWLRRRGKQQLQSPELMNRLADISERLDRLDGSIDTIAVEVERISEAQRFTAKVLVERAERPAIAELSRPVSSKTPH